MNPRTGAQQSLVQRLSRTLTAAVLAVWLLSIALVGWYVDSQIQDNFDVELIESAHRQLYPALLELQLTNPQNNLETALQVAAGGDPRVMGELPGSDHSEPLLLQLRNSDGKVLLRTKATPASPFAVPLEEGFYDTEDFRVFSLYDAQYHVWLQLADPVEERREASRRTVVGLAVVLLIMLPVMAWMVATVARRELRYVGQLQRQITARSGSNLQPLSVDGMPLELRVVGEGVNQLLERLGEALNVERSLAANAAHELRTPLAEVRLRLQTAIDQAQQHRGSDTHPAPGAEVEAVPLNEVKAVLHALEVMSHRAERLLQLSRAEGRDVAHFARVNLVQLAEQVAQEFWQQTYAHKRLDCLTPDAHEAVWVWGDLDGLAIVLRNLIENALRHSDGMVEVQVLPAPGAALLVRDSGAGLTAAQIQLIQRRHARMDRQHIGYGLGMSIVKTIADTHGAQLVFASPPPHAAHGLEVGLFFSAASNDAEEEKPCNGVMPFT